MKDKKIIKEDLEMLKGLLEKFKKENKQKQVQEIEYEIKVLEEMLRK